MGEDDVSRRPARVPEDARVRQRDLVGSDRDPRRAHAGGSRGVEPASGSKSRDGRRSRPSSRSKDGTIARLAFRQRDPVQAQAGLAAAAARRARLRRSRRSRSSRRHRRRATSRCRRPPGMPAPLYVLPNGGGWAYGGFTLDATIARLPDRRSLPDIADPLTRGARGSRCGTRCSTAACRRRGFVDLALRRCRARPTSS